MDFEQSSKIHFVADKEHAVHLHVAVSALLENFKDKENSDITIDLEKDFKQSDLQKLEEIFTNHSNSKYKIQTAELDSYNKYYSAHKGNNYRVKPLDVYYEKCNPWNDLRSKLAKKWWRHFTKNCNDSLYFRQLLLEIINNFDKFSANIDTASNYKESFIEIFGESLSNQLHSIVFQEGTNKDESDYLWRRIKYMQHDIYKALENSPNPLVTVAMPVYNASKYLRSTLDAILAQTYENFELICVNDGSTDDSDEILKEYAVKDKRIKIITQKNQGAGAARNTGIDVANGKYITFVDSDDLVNRQMLKRLSATAFEYAADIVISPFAQLKPNGKPYEKPRFIRIARHSALKAGVFDPKEVASTLFQITSVATHGKFFKVDSLRKNDVKFNNSRRGQDLFFTSLALVSVDSVAICNTVFYYYRAESENNLTSTRNFENLPGTLAVLTELADVLRHANLLDTFALSFAHLCLRTLSYEARIRVDNARKNSTLPLSELNQKIIDMYAYLKDDIMPRLDLNKIIDRNDFVPSPAEKAYLEKLRQSHKSEILRNRVVGNELARIEEVRSIPIDISGTSPKLVYAAGVVSFSPKISVIIPCYNTQDYIVECLDSVLTQTLKDIEVICIDDGSTDYTLAQLKDFADRDSRVRVIALETNMGVSVARNTGLETAVGEYIYFIDSDDMLMPHCLKRLYSLAKENCLDLVMLNFSAFANDNSVATIKAYEEKKNYYLVECDLPYICNGIELMKVMHKKAPRMTGPPSSMISRLMLIDNNIRFPEGINGSEDNYFTFLVDLYAKRAYYSGEYLYLRRIRQGSLETSTTVRDRARFSINNFKIARLICKAWKHYLNERPEYSPDKEIGEILAQRIYSYYMNAQVAYGDVCNCIDAKQLLQDLSPEERVDFQVIVAGANKSRLRAENRLNNEGANKRSWNELYTQSQYELDAVSKKSLKSQKKPKRLKRVASTLRRLFSQ